MPLTSISNCDLLSFIIPTMATNRDWLLVGSKPFRGINSLVLAVIAVLFPFVGE